MGSIRKFSEETNNQTDDKYFIPLQLQIKRDGSSDIFKKAYYKIKRKFRKEFSFGILGFYKKKDVLGWR